MALLGGLVFKLDVQWVVLMIMAEEVTSMVFGLRRYISRRWTHDLTKLA